MTSIIFGLSIKTLHPTINAACFKSSLAYNPSKQSTNKSKHKELQLFSSMEDFTFLASMHVAFNHAVKLKSLNFSSDILFLAKDAAMPSYTVDSPPPPTLMSLM